jgi:hypothetical protein
LHLIFVSTLSLEARANLRGVAAATIVWAIALGAWRALMFHPRAQLVAAGVAIDLTLSAALAAYLLSRRARTAFFIGGAGVTLAAIAVAPARPLVALVEPAILIAAIWRLPKLRRAYVERRAAGDDAVDALSFALAAALGSRVLGVLLATELTMLALAFGGWFRRAPAAGIFVARRRWRIILALLTFLVAVESTALHLLVALWSRPLALVLTLLAAYSLAWLLGDYQALRLLPSTIEGDELRIRVGLRWSARLALSSITAIERVDGAPADALRATVSGAANVVIRARGVAHGPFGIRREFSALALELDDPAALSAVRR